MSLEQKLTIEQLEIKQSQTSRALSKIKEFSCALQGLQNGSEINPAAFPYPLIYHPALATTPEAVLDNLFRLGATITRIQQQVLPELHLALTRLQLPTIKKLTLRLLRLL